MPTKQNTPAVVPEGMDSATHARVVKSRDALAKSLEAAKGAAVDSIESTYGVGVTPAAVSLAKRAADMLADPEKLKKLKGGASTDIRAVLAALAKLRKEGAAPAKVYAPESFALAALARIEERNALHTARVERRKNAAKVATARDSSPAQREGALAVLTGIDAEDNRAKVANVSERFTAVLKAARDAGIPAATLGDMLAAAYGVDVAVTYPAAVPADSVTVAA